MTAAWQVFPDQAAVLEALCQRMATLSSQAICERGRFDLVLAGGETPKALYALLAGLETDWSRWFFWFGDERCLPQGHPQRNESMVRAVWLDKVSVPPANCHPLPVDHKAAALLSCQQALDGVDSFDLVLLGVGEDGHTASLFPGGALRGEPGTPDLVCVENAPKPPAARISLAADRLARTHALWFLATGEHKRAILTRLLAGETLPVNRLASSAPATFFIDEAAAPLTAGKKKQ